MITTHARRLDTLRTSNYGSYSSQSRGAQNRPSSSDLRQAASVVPRARRWTLRQQPFVWWPGSRNTVPSSLGLNGVCSATAGCMGRISISRTKPLAVFLGQIPLYLSTWYIIPTAKKYFCSADFSQSQWLFALQYCDVATFFFCSRSGDHLVEGYLAKLILAVHEIFLS